MHDRLVLVSPAHDSNLLVLRSKHLWKFDLLPGRCYQIAYIAGSQHDPHEDDRAGVRGPQSLSPYRALRRGPCIQVMGLTAFQIHHIEFCR